MRKTNTTFALILAVILIAIMICGIKCKAQEIDSIPEKQNYHELGRFEDSIITEYPKKLLIFNDKKHPHKQVYMKWVWNRDVDEKTKKLHKMSPIKKGE